jgi:hypothetical protein
VERLSWAACTELTVSILKSPPGEWSHRMEGKLVRFERRVRTPNGQVRIFYSGQDCAGIAPRNGGIR